MSAEPTDSKPETPLEDTPMTGTEDAGLEQTTEPKEGEKPAETEPEPVDLEKVRAAFQETAKNYLIEQSRHVVIPSFSKWFDMNTTHLIEKKLFPDFFPAKTEETPSTYKSPEVYKNMRDFMINSYRINPIEYLTVTAVRRNLAGDVASIIRIHRFLEKWGLINYQIDPRTKPTLVGPQFTGHFQVTLDTPQGLVPFVPESVKLKDASETPAAEIEGNGKPQEVKSEKTVKLEEKADGSIPLNLEVTRNIFDESTNQKAPNSVLYFCNETSNDVSKVRYHNLKSKALTSGTLGPLVISKEVFEQGLFPSNFTSSDFVKLEQSFKQKEWTEQEVLLLLEGIEMYATTDVNNQTLFLNNNGQWDKIGEHVGSKSRDECLIKFLQLPIEERYLNNLIKPDAEKKKQPDSLDKDSIIQDVVKKLVESREGKATLQENAKKNLEQTVLDQTNLVNQVIELTLEKFDAKVKLINHLEADLIKTENLLNLQRKQALIERWLNFEKVSKFKKENNNPELEPLLNELLTPININEINKNFNKINLDNSEQSKTDSDKEKVEEALPISVVKPKAYQFWSA
ncbi:hypothetical protein C7M61_000511 [Candidozyma pseudohaemuli]|uniref:SWIRM domain-containing protein n=1 Tax=Candidozyma pseudohaemuli TaxID=418784 RepID=A0A2P7YY18_9ASCO|nr:hypothetical protein C7M61_000511 [[Candida] pseudohaemulonii]PSK40849.1 hypothetical protein C7M61_000511 [[Candida] pseudohaemulonii]